MSADVTARAVVDDLRSAASAAEARKGTTPTPSRRAGPGRPDEVGVRRGEVGHRLASGRVGTTRLRADLRGPDGGLQHPRLQGPSGPGQPGAPRRVPAAPRPDHRLGHGRPSRTSRRRRRSRRVVRRAARARDIDGPATPPVCDTAPLWFTRHGDEDDLAAGFAIAAVLCADVEPSVHKAVGIFLAHAGERDPAALAQFLGQHSSSMPATARRLATRKQRDG